MATAGGPKAKGKLAKAADAALRVRQARDAATLFKQASDPTRLRVLLALEGGERHVGDLLGEMDDMTQPAMSHHLALLRHGRLVEARRAGKHNFYGLTEAGRGLTAVVKTVAL